MSLATTVRQNTRKNEATVESVRRFGDGLVRISTTPRDADLAWVAGQAVAVIVDPDGSTLKDRWRHYTVRAQRPDGGLDFVVVEHDPSTPAGSWLADLDEGDTFTFMGPGGSPTLTPTSDPLLFIGDRTSCASIAAMVDALRAVVASPTFEVVVATPDPSAAQLDTVEPTNVRWVEASTADEIRTGLVDAVPDHVDRHWQAYVTGELHAMRALRNRLSDVGVPRRAVHTHAHWTPTKRGM